jgi:uncharacterized repeat protein (TIGR01451 family)
VKRSWFLLALALIGSAPPCRAQTGTNGPVQSTEFPAFIRTLRDRNLQPIGQVRIQLVVETGAFYFAETGRLRAYSHRYRYRLRNIDLPGGDDNFITRFAPAFCLTSPILLAPQVLSGDGDPLKWMAATLPNGGTSLARWDASDPARDGLPPQSEWEFDLYTNAEPELGFVFVFGQAQLSAGGSVTNDTNINYWVPGCSAETRPGVAELDWVKSVDAVVSSSGHLINYTLRATNFGSGTATGVVIMDTIPGSVLYESGTTTLYGAPFDDPAPGVSAVTTGLPIPPLAPGATAVVRFRVRVRPGQAGGRTIDNTATLSTSVTQALPSPRVSTALLPPDVNPPQITLTSPTATVYQKPEFSDPVLVPIRFTVTDADPGVDPASVSATFDGTPVQSGQTVDLFTLLPGPHTVRVHAADWAGNAADSTFTFTVGVTFDSTMTEVWRMHDLGWIPRWRTAASLNQLLDVAQQNLAAGKRDAARAGLQAFLTTVANPKRRPQDPPLMNDQAAAQLTTTVQYLLARLQKNPALKCRAVRGKSAFADCALRQPAQAGFAGTGRHFQCRIVVTHLTTKPPSLDGMGALF